MSNDQHTTKVRKLMGSKTYRPVCSCGFEGSNGTKAAAERRNEQHEKNAR